MDAIILSAGEGTRLRPMTLHRPKPLIPVLCEPIFEHIISSLEASGIYRAAVNLWHLRDEFANYIENRSASAFETIAVFERQILGTGGGIVNAALALDGDEPILVHNGDIYADIDFAEAIRSHRRSGALLTLLVRDGAAEIAAEGEAVVDIAGKTGCRGSATFKFTGIAIWERAALFALPRPGTPGCALEAIAHLIESHPGSVRTFHIGDAFWFDIGTPEAYLDLHKRLIGERGVFPKNLSIPPGVNLGGFICACEGARIGAGARLRDVVIWPGGIVPPGTRLDRAVVGPFGIFRL